jgi:DNA-binding MarR family transcriptional regulator
MPPKPRVEPGIGFLLADVSRLLRRDFDRRLRSLELTQAQWRAIAHLTREEGINQSALAERLEVAPITLARLVDRMEAAGWLKRRADPSDRRASLLYLTPKAQPIVDQMYTIADELLDNLMTGIPGSAREQLVATLNRMKMNLVGTIAGESTRGKNNNGGARQAAKSAG